MKKIIVASPMEFSDQQRQRLKKLGNVTYFDTRAETPEDWLKRVQGFDIICTGIFGIKDQWPKLKNVYVSLPFVGVGWADSAMLKSNNVAISNSPGCNRHPVSEWIIAMMIIMSRKLDKYLNAPEVSLELLRTPPTSPAFKNITILGKGNIGSRVGEIANAMEMNVKYFTRGDNLQDSVKDADFVIDALGLNPTTKGLLNKSFFGYFKDNAMFISITGGEIIDINAMGDTVDKGRLSSVAWDGGAMAPGDTKDKLYQRLLKHPRVFITPHIAYNSDVERRLGNDMMIANVEAWVSGKPINVIG